MDEELYKEMATINRLLVERLIKKGYHNWNTFPLVLIKNHIEEQVIYFKKENKTRKYNAGAKYCMEEKEFEKFWNEIGFKPEQFLKESGIPQELIMEK